MYEIWEPDISEKMDTDVKWRLFGMAYFDQVWVTSAFCQKRNP